MAGTDKTIDEWMPGPRERVEWEIAAMWFFCK